MLENDTLFEKVQQQELSSKVLNPVGVSYTTVRHVVDNTAFDQRKETRSRMFARYGARRLYQAVHDHFIQELS